MSRVWAMPNKWTFEIPPIAELLNRYVNGGKGWADPFAGMKSPAEIKNDIRPDMNADYHMDAEDFANILNDGLEGVLFDPPYSLEQCKRVYESVHRTFTMRDGQICGRWTKLRGILSRKVKPDGIAICFGWNSQGFGKSMGFSLEEILLVAHGPGHNDTIVTVEKKVQLSF